MTEERTVALIKPDVVKANREYNLMVYAFAEHRLDGVRIVRTQQQSWDRATAEAFYADHKGKDFFDELVEFMSSGPLVAVILEGHDVIKRWRGLMGSADPKKAARGTLRDFFGEGQPNNAVHGSDSPEAYLKESALLFGES